MPVPHNAPVTIDIALADRAATRRLAIRLAACLGPGDMVGLGGPLGAGKTTLARDVIETLAGEACEVPSPTFTLVQTYDVGGLRLAHFDLYRIAAPEEIYELGFDEALDEGAVLVEWPDRLGPLIPADRLDLVLVTAADSDARVARLTGHGGWKRRIAALAGTQ